VDPAAKPENKMMLITPIAFSGLRSAPSSERSRINFPDRDFGIGCLSYGQVSGSAAWELAGYAYQELNYGTDKSAAAGKKIAIQESVPNRAKMWCMIRGNGGEP
jgi:hypothetical protein